MKQIDKKFDYLNEENYEFRKSLEGKTKKMDTMQNLLINLKMELEDLKQDKKTISTSSKSDNQRNNKTSCLSSFKENKDIISNKNEEVKEDNLIDNNNEIIDNKDETISTYRSNDEFNFSILNENEISFKKPDIVPKLNLKV